MITKTQIIITLTLAYFWIPKIDLLNFDFTPTGIRIQDFISLLILLLLFETRIHINTLLTLALLIIHLVYSIFFWDSYISILGLLRYIQYYIIARAIVFIINEGLWRSFFYSMLSYCLIVSFMQYLHLLPNFDPGRSAIYSSQFSGPFGTPAELTYFLISILYLNSIVSKTSILALATSSLVLLNGVKAGLLGFTILWIKKALDKKALSRLFVLSLVFFSILLLQSYVIIIFDFIRLVYETTLTSDPSFDNLKTSPISGLNMISERSLVDRIGKWSTGISIMFDNPQGLLFGFGIYSLGGAHDGGILRFLYEFGVLIFIYATVIIYKRSVMFLIVIVAISLLADSYISSVVMPIILATFVTLGSKLKYVRNEK